MKINLSDLCLRSFFTAVLLAALPGGVGGVRAADLQGNLTVSGDIGVGTATPEPSAQLDVSSTSKGLLPPRLLAAQREDIVEPAEGLLVYQTDAPAGLYSYNGTAWVLVGATVSANTILPAQSGNNGKVLTTNGSTVSWGAAAAGTVTSVSGTDPISVTNGTTTPMVALTGTVPVANGGTGATTAAAARTALSAAAAGANGDITSLTGLTTALTIGQGGTGAATAAAARTNLGLGSAAVLAATNANTASTVVQRDASGNFSAGTITATLTGTASKATNLIGGNNTTLLGAIGYQSAADTTTLLAPNTTTTKKFLRMTGTGTNGAAPAWDILAVADIPTLNQNSTGTAANVTGTVAIANGGTGATTAALARTALGAAAAGANSDITSLGGLTTDITVAQGGTGASTLTGLLRGTGTTAVTGGATVALASEVSGTLPVANGGTGATTAALARTALSAAAAGANSDITSLGGLTTDITVAQGGTGVSTLTGYVKGSGTAALTASATIPGADLSGTVAIANGGTDATTATAALTNLLPAQTGNSGKVLTSNGSAASWAAPAAATLDYALAKTGASQWSVSTDGPIPWAPVGLGTTIRGEITLDATYTLFNLKAGKTYELQGYVVPVFSSPSAGLILVRWLSSTGTVVGDPNILATVHAPSAPGYTYSEGGQPAIAVFTPAVDTKVKLQVTAVSNLTGMRGEGAHARIIQLP